MCGNTNKIISLLILTIKNTKKTKLASFPSCILSCKQEWVHYTNFFWHKYPPTNHRKDTTLNWCLKVRTSGGGGYLAALIFCPTLGRRHEPNVMLTFNHHVYSVFGFSLDNTQIGIIPSSPFKDKVCGNKKHKNNNIMREWWQDPPIFFVFGEEMGCPLRLPLDPFWFIRLARQSFNASLAIKAQWWTNNGILLRQSLSQWPDVYWRLHMVSDARGHRLFVQLAVLRCGTRLWFN